MDRAEDQADHPRVDQADRGQVGADEENLLEAHHQGEGQILANPEINNRREVAWVIGVPHPDHHPVGMMNSSGSSLITIVRI